jgi:hypothetical protein
MRWKWDFVSEPSGPKPVAIIRGFLFGNDRSGKD